MPFFSEKKSSSLFHKVAALTVSTLTATTFALGTTNKAEAKSAPVTPASSGPQHTGTVYTNIDGNNLNVARIVEAGTNKEVAVVEYVLEKNKANPDVLGQGYVTSGPYGMGGSFELSGKTYGGTGMKPFTPIFQTGAFDGQKGQACNSGNMNPCINMLTGFVDRALFLQASVGERKEAGMKFGDGLWGNGAVVDVPHGGTVQGATYNGDQHFTLYLSPYGEFTVASEFDSPTARGKDKASITFGPYSSKRLVDALEIANEQYSRMMEGPDRNRKKALAPGDAVDLYLYRNLVMAQAAHMMTHNNGSDRPGTRPQDTGLYTIRVGNDEVVVMDARRLPDLAQPSMSSKQYMAFLTDRYHAALGMTREPEPYRGNTSPVYRDFGMPQRR